MTHKEYRIIFYFDNRYNKDRYVIVGGNYLEAIRMTKHLEVQTFASNISRYWAVDRQYVDLHSEDNMFRFKSTYKDLGNRQYWDYIK